MCVCLFKAIVNCYVISSILGSWRILNNYILMDQLILRNCLIMKVFKHAQNGDISVLNSHTCPPVSVEIRFATLALLAFIFCCSVLNSKWNHAILPLLPWYLSLEKHSIVTKLFDCYHANKIKIYWLKRFWKGNGLGFMKTVM